MGLQKTFFPPGEQEIAQRRGVIVAINVGALHRVEHRDFFRREPNWQLGNDDRRIGKFRFVGGIAAQRAVGLDDWISKVLWRALTGEYWDAGHLGVVDV